MNLVDQLLEADAKKADELNTGVFYSKKLQKILGAESPIEVKIREIKTRRFNDIVATQYDNNGNFNVSKAFDAKLKSVVEGCVEPSLKDKELQAHFNVSTAVELAEKLFGTEVTELSEAIERLSIVSDIEDNEIKN